MMMPDLNATEMLFVTAKIIAGFAGGYAVGLIHFRTLMKVTHQLVEGQAFRAIGFQLLRFVVLALLLVASAVYGGAAVLATAAAGILLARRRVLKQVEAGQ